MHQRGQTAVLKCRDLVRLFVLVLLGPSGQCDDGDAALDAGRSRERIREIEGGAGGSLDLIGDGERRDSEKTFGDF